MLKVFGGGVHLYQLILKCFDFDEKSTIALENILMEKSASNLSTVLRQDGSLLKPMYEGNEHISRTYADVDVDIAAYFLRGGLSYH